MDTNYAGFWPRAAASIVDNLICAIPSWIIIFLDSSGHRQPDGNVVLCSRTD